VPEDEVRLAADYYKVRSNIELLAVDQTRVFDVFLDDNVLELFDQMVQIDLFLLFQLRTSLLTLLPD